jgi:cytochrome oxidase Cu insertion factor (SCO1/SenC/PrrC family)
VEHPLNEGRDSRVAATLAAFGFIGVVTVAWWALALWPVPGVPPDWLTRTRALCFGTQADGLPSAAGWLLLMAEPPTMLIALTIIAGDSVPAAVTFLMARRSGRVATAGLAMLLLVGLAGAGLRVAKVKLDGGEAVAAPSAPEKIDGPPPRFALQSQLGDTLSAEHFHGRVVLVGFAYGHCETVCPTVVHELLDARSRLTSESPVVLILTLDPWRDTPSRLPSLASRWNLPMGAFVLSGSVPAVEKALDAWNVARSRDPDTGEIIHTTQVFVIDGAGKLRYRVGPYASAIADAVRKL